VFDNCEDPALLAQWQPKTGGCRVLLTSRRATWPALTGVRPLALAPLLRAESIALLRAHRPDLPTADRDLRAIAAALGDLPLAVHMAGSFLAQYQDTITPAAYVTHLQRPGILEHSSLRHVADGDYSPTGHDLQVARTFALSYERLRADDPTDHLARSLLARAIWFAPGEPLPGPLLFSALSPAPDEDTSLRTADALTRLVHLGLVERTSQAPGAAVRLHRLVVAHGAHRDRARGSPPPLRAALPAVAAPLGITITGCCLAGGSTRRCGRGHHRCRWWRRRSGPT
jgi:hypothetical protein